MKKQSEQKESEVENDMFPEEKIYDKTTDQLEKAIGNLGLALQNIQDAEVEFTLSDIKNTAIPMEIVNNYMTGFRGIEKTVNLAIKKVKIARTGMYNDLNRLDEFQMERKSEGWFSSLQN